MSTSVLFSESKPQVHARVCAGEYRPYGEEFSGVGGVAFRLKHVTAVLIALWFIEVSHTGALFRAAHKYLMLA